MNYRKVIKCNKCNRIDYFYIYPNQFCPRCGNKLSKYIIDNEKKSFIVSDNASIVIAKRFLFWDKIADERK